VVAVLLGTAGCSLPAGGIDAVPVAVVRPAAPPDKPVVQETTIGGQSVSPMLTGGDVRDAPAAARRSATTTTSGGVATSPPAPPAYSCAGATLVGFQKSVPLSVAVSPGVVSVTWPYNGDASLRSYRVFGVVDDATVFLTEILAPKDCRPQALTATVPLGAAWTRREVSFLVEAVTGTDYSVAAEHYASGEHSSHVQVGRSAVLTVR
jgi:hypothetical protein